jgi:hypothetical protein
MQQSRHLEIGFCRQLAAAGPEELNSQALRCLRIHNAAVHCVRVYIVKAFGTAKRSYGLHRRSTLASTACGERRNLRRICGDKDVNGG